jgi:hypothetical protein
MITFDPFDDRIRFPKNNCFLNALLLSGNNVFLRNMALHRHSLATDQLETLSGPRSLVFDNNGGLIN